MNNKKILYIAIAAIVVIVAVLVVVFAGGNNTTNNTNNTTSTTTTTSQKPTGLSYKDSLELLNKVFTSYNATAPEEAQLWVAGGNANNFDTVSFDSPAAFIPGEEGANDYDFHLGFPAAEVSKIENAASMYNMMNTNIFNCYTVKLTNGTDAKAMANTLKNNILAREWVCGMPEKLVILNCPGNYLLVVWGVVADGGIVNPFVESVFNTIDGSTIVVEEDIAR